MFIIDNGMLWRQFGAAIDRLGNALRDCPDELWEARLWEDQPDQWVASGFSTFWCLGYHTLGFSKEIIVQISVIRAQWAPA